MITNIFQIRKIGKIGGCEILKDLFENDFSTKKNLIMFIELRIRHNKDRSTYPEDMEGLTVDENGDATIEFDGTVYIARKRRSYLYH